MPLLMAPEASCLRQFRPPQNLQQDPHRKQEDPSKLLSDTLSKMSIQDREEAYEDVHCIPPSEIIESPELVQTAMKALESELQRLRVEHLNDSSTTLALPPRSNLSQQSTSEDSEMEISDTKSLVPTPIPDIGCSETMDQPSTEPERIPPSTQRIDTSKEDENAIKSKKVQNTALWKGYLLAERENYSYVHDEALRLQFLRAEDFHADKAALRFLRHFQFKLQYFRRDALARDVTWDDDLEHDDQKMLRQGLSHILPTRDQADRAVLVMTTSDDLGSNVDSMVSLYHIEHLVAPVLVLHCCLSSLFYVSFCFNNRRERYFTWGCILGQSTWQLSKL